jgi:predicted nuclease of predicted toxin-antitoxin system
VSECGEPRFPYRFLLDADISPDVARVARALGLDVISVYECGRAELRDDEQLRLAASDGRIFVTRNRNDFLRWTAEFIRMGNAHRGVLIASRSVAAIEPEPLAYALLRWTGRMTIRLEGEPLEEYFLDFLTALAD